MELFDGARLTQSLEAGTHALGFTPGTRFTTGVVFEIAPRARPATVSAGPEHATTESFDASATGWHGDPASGGTLRVKPAPGAASVTVR
jgi:hypothetical protein